MKMPEYLVQIEEKVQHHFVITAPCKGLAVESALEKLNWESSDDGNIEITRVVELPEPDDEEEGGD
jgi:hypothetical protein